MIRYITSFDENPANPSSLFRRVANVNGSEAVPPLASAVIVTVSALTGEALSHNCAQCPFAETFVFSTFNRASLTRNRAPERVSPCTSNIALGISAHQFGGSTFVIRGAAPCALITRGNIAHAATITRTKFITTINLHS
jgi:hypothetical protein